MTTIQMITNDQVLIGVQKPKVAAGDVNSVLLHVDFDAVWDNYTSKSACFHTAKDTTVHEVLMTKNECIVPAAVLADEGIIFIGIRGIKADGETIKTSTLAKYKVVAGATAGQKTIYPELDMYQQYLAAINTNLAPALEAMQKQVDEKIAEIDEKIAETEEAFNEQIGRFVKPADFSSVLKTLSLTKESPEAEWTATKDCWVKAQLTASGYYVNSTLSIDGVSALTLKVKTGESSDTDYNIAGPVYVKAGSVIKYSVATSEAVLSFSSANCTVYGCVE